VFSKSVEILFIQYLFSVKLNAEKMKEDKLKISVFSIIAFFIANNMSKEEWTWHETVFALLGAFRWPNVVPTRHTLGAAWFCQNTGEKNSKKYGRKGKNCWFLKNSTNRTAGWYYDFKQLACPLTNNFKWLNNSQQSSRRALVNPDIYQNYQNLRQILR